MSGLILSAPSSGAGKTTLTLALLRALINAGASVRAAKSGPDYIDPRFHAAACHAGCFNLDAWAMSPARIKSLASGDTPLIIEGAMGLFDGAPPAGRGATADLARQLGLPVVLILDAARMAQSVAPLAMGFANHDTSVKIAGVILNRVGSDRHEIMLRDAMAPTGLPVLGSVRRNSELSQPSRHLGLIQASERPDLDAFLDCAAALIAPQLDMDAITALLAGPNLSSTSTPRTAPPAQNIAIASDAAFAFAYPHLLEDWRSAGAQITPFSPLNNDPAPQADLIVLPGGYPELHAGQIAANSMFINSLKNAPRDTQIYGECGGYMTLGSTLIDADGTPHRMAGLLDLETSFATRKLHLGYRTVHATAGPFTGEHMAHEFHYATTLRAQGTPLFTASDATGTSLEPMGLTTGRVHGSFAHIIDAPLP
jgi:cobyrinic acid a,c-diamide synthase